MDWSFVANAQLMCALFTLFVMIVGLTGVRHFGGLPISLVGPDLNLISFGFCWDTIVNAMTSEPYWRHYDLALAKPVMLGIVAFTNFMLLIWNYKVARHAEGPPRRTPHVWLSTMLGVPSALFFIFARGIWGA